MNKLEKHIKYNHNTNLYSLQQMHTLYMGVKETIYHKDKLTKKDNSASLYFGYINF